MGSHSKSKHQRGEKEAYIKLAPKKKRKKKYPNTKHNFYTYTLSFSSSSSYENKLTKNPPRCATKMLPLSLWTTDPECARPGSPVTTPPEPSSPPSSAAPGIRASWSAWDKKTPTSATRPSPREVSSLSSTPSSMES